MLLPFLSTLAAFVVNTLIPLSWHIRPTLADHGDVGLAAVAYEVIEPGDEVKAALVATGVLKANVTQLGLYISIGSRDEILVLNAVNAMIEKAGDPEKLPSAWVTSSRG